MTKQKIPQKYQDWIDAQKRHRLSHRHVQMARELGLNPKKLGKIDNHKQEPWKVPLPEFIEDIYFKRFGKSAPDTSMTIEQIIEKANQKKEEKKERKALKKLMLTQDAKISQRNPI